MSVGQAASRATNLSRAYFKGVIKRARIPATVQQRTLAAMVELVGGQLASDFEVWAEIVEAKVVEKRRKSL